MFLFSLTTRVDGLNASKIKWSKFLRCTRSFIVQVSTVQENGQNSCDTFNETVRSLDSV